MATWRALGTSKNAATRYNGADGAIVEKTGSTHPWHSTSPPHTLGYIAAGVQVGFRGIKSDGADGARGAESDSPDSIPMNLAWYA